MAIIDHLLAKQSPIFFSLHYEVFCVTSKFILRHIISKILTLLGSNISWHWLCIGVIMLWYFMSSLLEYPVILVIVIVTTFVHQVLEYFSHVIVIRSFLEFQVSAVL